LELVEVGQYIYYFLHFLYPSSSQIIMPFMDRMLYRVPSGIHLHDVEGIRLTVIKHPMNVPYPITEDKFSLGKGSMGLRLLAEFWPVTEVLQKCIIHTHRNPLLMV
jgi:hypothetical protein